MCLFFYIGMVWVNVWIIRSASEWAFCSGGESLVPQNGLGVSFELSLKPRLNEQHCVVSGVHNKLTLLKKKKTKQKRRRTVSASYVIAHANVGEMESYRLFSSFQTTSFTSIVFPCPGWRQAETFKVRVVWWSWSSDSSTSAAAVGENSNLWLFIYLFFSIHWVPGHS